MDVKKKLTQAFAYVALAGTAAGCTLYARRIPEQTAIVVQEIAAEDVDLAVARSEYTREQEARIIDEQARRRAMMEMATGTRQRNAYYPQGAPSANPRNGRGGPPVVGTDQVAVVPQVILPEGFVPPPKRPYEVDPSLVPNRMYGGLRLLIGAARSFNTYGSPYGSPYGLPYGTPVVPVVPSVPAIPYGIPNYQLMPPGMMAPR
jgi:hypothetical protein